jgi:hypothetical protein
VCRGGCPPKARITAHKEVRKVSKDSRTFLIGRNAKTGELMKVKAARNSPTAIVERMPKKGYGDTKKTK